MTDGSKEFENMEIRDVMFEGPYHIGQDFVPHIETDCFPSLEGLRRENTELGTLQTDCVYGGDIECTATT